MASSGRPGRKTDVLSKKIPENPKYKHVKATIDTGASLSKYLKHLEEIRKNYRFRKDEIFRRLKVTTFVQLVVQVAVASEPEEIVDVPFQQPIENHLLAESPPSTSRSTLTSVVQGIGELDVNRDYSPPATLVFSPATSSPYLLLDVRDKDEFEQCHIVTAKSYPAAMLSRSCNYFTRDILEYINKPGKIIILYDNNERIAPHAATVFVERGVDNVFLLSGGLKVLYKVFPKGIISGTIPPSCKPSPPPSSRRQRPSSHVPASYSHLPTHPFLPSQPHPPTPSINDISVLQDRLEEVLMASVPSSRNSSRSSIGSRASVASAGCIGRASSQISTSRSTIPWK